MRNFVISILLFLSTIKGKIASPIRNRIQIRKKAHARQTFEKKQRERYVFHSMLKAGDQYRLGEATVTLAKFGVEGKEEVRKKIEAAERRRSERKRILTERAEEMMLMKPEELEKFQIEKWFSDRKEFQQKLSQLDLAPAAGTRLGPEGQR